MTNLHHIPYEQLVDLAEGRLSTAETTALRERIAADPTAAAEFAGIEQLIRLMRTDAGEDAPSHVINRAVRLLRAPAMPAARSLAHRIVAILRTDSWRLPLAPGLRSEQLLPRDMVFNAEDRDLDLQIAPRAGLWQLRGQVLGTDEAGDVELIGDAARATASVNQLGEFVLEPVPAGSYTLLLRQGDREVVVEDLELGLSPPQS